MNVREPYEPKGYKEEYMVKRGYREETLRETYETFSDKWTLICEASTFFSKYYNDLQLFFKKNPNSL